MLQPTTPLYNPRYDQAKRVTTSHRLISVGLFSSLADPEPPYLPPYWERRVQPEGSTYFVRDSVPKVITSADMEDSTIQENIGTCIGAVHKMLSEQNLKLSDSTELYLELDEEAESGRYYLVDHATRTLFWLESVETDELGIPKTVSGDHLRSALEGQYWQHVEYFPCHQATGLNLSLNELIHVFSQAQADHMTSDTSTFPYSAEQSKEIAQILTTFQSSSDVSGYARWTIARFWASVANYRTMNHHGQEVCRLSIDQSILESTAVSASSWAYELTSKAFFGVPASYQRRFKTLWTDEIVNVHHWRRFADSCHTEWKACLLIGFALLLTNLILSCSPIMTSTAYSAVCIFLSNTAIVSAIAMLLQYRHAPTQTASQAAAFLDHAGKGRSDFRTISIHFSIPRILLLWTLVASTVQTLLPFLGGMHTCILFAAIASVICVYQVSVASSRLIHDMWTYVHRVGRRKSQTADEAV